jgi:hypothetical protein
VTSTDDYPGQLDDATVERLLAGRPVTAELESVTTVVRALREASAEPVRPSAELARQMAAGEFTGTPVYSYRPPLGPRLARRARRVAAAMTTPGRLSVPARLAAAGVAVALVGVGSAGFAGTLPDPVQDQFESVVETVSPYEFPAKAADPDQRGGRAPQEQENQPGGGVTDPPEHPDNSGGEVGEDDKDKGDKDDKDDKDEDKADKDQDKADKDKDKGKGKDKDKGRPDDLPPPATAPPGQSGD